MYLTPVIRRNDAPKLRSDIDRVFESFFSESPGAWEGLNRRNDGASEFMPKLEVIETPKELYVKAELAGVDPGQVDVSLADGILTIRGEKHEEKVERQRGFYHSERSFGGFLRQIQLPNTIDSDKVDAEFKNGLLTVTIGKARGAEPKKVPILAK